MARKRTKLIHEGKYAAEVPVDVIEDGTAWSPYLSPVDVQKLDSVHDKELDSRFRGNDRVYETLTPVSCPGLTRASMLT